MFCKNCGSQLVEGAAFCVHCGAAAPEGQKPVATPVIVPEVDTSNQETVAFTPVQQAPAPQVQQTQQYQPVQQYQPQPQPVYTPPAPVSTASKKASSEGKNRTVIIVVIAVVLVAILGVVAALLLLGNNGGDSDGGSRKSNSSGIVDDQNDDNAVKQEKRELSSSNAYYEFYVDADSYVLSATDTRYYSRSELSSMTRQQLYLAERELFARYGCTFSDGDLDDYFCAKNWYSPDSPAGNFNESRFNPTERVNLLLLRAMLMERDGTYSNNEYLKLNKDVEGWIMNFTDGARITKDDVKGLSEKELILASHEIYARHGYIFDDDALQLYFSSKNWYTPEHPASSFDSSTVLSEIEQENYTCLQECAKKIAGVRFSSGNKYETYFYSYTEYQCPGSDKTAINPYELEYMSAEQLTLARNEIYARYGYSFSNSSLREYFMNCSWYYPTVVNTKLELIHLSSTELANVKMIQAFELNLKLAAGEGTPNTKMSYYAKHDMLTMYLPEHWRDNCICIKPNGTSGDMYFYEKYNYEKNGKGWLFSIQFMPISSDLDGFRDNAEIFGTVKDSAGNEYYVIKVMPYSYSSNTDFLEYVYSLMDSQIDTIWNSIEWKSGYTFTPA